MCNRPIAVNRILAPKGISLDRLEKLLVQTIKHFAEPLEIKKTEFCRDGSLCYELAVHSPYPQCDMLIINSVHEGLFYPESPAYDFLITSANIAERKLLVDYTNRSVIQKVDAFTKLIKDQINASA